MPGFHELVVFAVFTCSVVSNSPAFADASTKETCATKDPLTKSRSEAKQIMDAAKLEQTLRRSPAKSNESESPGLLEMSGFRLIEKKPNYERYALVDKPGSFIISKKGFSSRKGVEAFCKSNGKLEIANLMVAGVMTISGLPFPALMKHNAIADQILSEPNDSTRKTSGIVFWIKDKDPLASEFPDTVLAFLDGCGEFCSNFVRLSTLSVEMKKNQKAKSTKIEPLAICVEPKLTKSIDLKE